MPYKTRRFDREKKDFKKKNAFFTRRKKICRFCADKNRARITYKDSKALESFINERSKIISTRLSGNCAKHQRRLVEAIKRARFMALLPYTK